MVNTSNRSTTRVFLRKLNIVVGCIEILHVEYVHVWIVAIIIVIPHEYNNLAVWYDYRSHFDRLNNLYNHRVCRNLNA